MSIIASTVTLNSKLIEVIQAQIVYPQLKHVLDKARSLAFNVMNDENKDKVFSLLLILRGYGTFAIGKQKIIQRYQIQSNSVLIQ